jgi:hypothetical protein
MDSAMVRLCTPSAECEAEPQSGPVRTALFEGAEEIVQVSAWETAAFVFHLQQDPLGAGTGPQRDRRVRPRELERVLQQIRHHRGQNLPVRFDRHAIVDRRHRERDASGVCGHHRGRRQLRDELGDGKALSMQHALCEPDLGERVSDEIPSAQEAPMEHRPSAAGDADVSGFHDVERDERGIEQVAQFMRKEPEPHVLAIGVAVDGGLIALAPELRDGARDRVIQASVQHPEVIGADGRVRFDGQFRDGLTDVAVVVDDL